MNMDEGIMRAIRVAKVTVNMGVGEPGEPLKTAQAIMESVTGAKTVQTKARVRLPNWNIRPGLPIGVKTTLRHEKAEAFLKKTLHAKENRLLKRNFDNRGNFGFGIREHIDIQGVKYDPKMGIRGFDVLVSLDRPGYRVTRRKIRKTPIGRRQIITQQEAIAFVSQKFGVTVDE